MDDFERATARTHRLARRLLRAGVDPGILSDAFISEGLALWAAQTGQNADAAQLARTWSAIREATDGN